MLGLSASITADDVCIRCRVRRSPYALNPEYDDEVEMQCTLRSWNENVVEDAAASGSGGKGVTSQWLAKQQQEQQQRNNDGDLIDGTSQHQTGSEIIFQPVHSHSTVVVRHESTCSEGKGGVIDGNAGVGNSNGEILTNQRFSHIRTRSGSTGRSPIVGRPPVASIDRKNLIPAGDGAGSNPGSRSSSRSRARLLSRSGSRAGRLPGSSAAALDLFDAGSLNDSDFSSGKKAGGGCGSITDSPYNSDGEGGSTAGSLSPSAAGTLSVPLPPPPPSYRILASDIIVVDVAAERDITIPAAERSKKIYLTTISSGYFECTFDSFNSHSVMVAFLKAVLPSERLNRTGEHQTKNQDRFAAACCTTDIRESYDMENFTAREMKETVERESLFAKLRRRITHITGQCGELSAQLSDTICGGQSMDAYAETRTVNYSAGAFDSTITTPVHGSRPVVQLDDSAVLPDEPKISFEATPSRDDHDLTDLSVKDKILNNGDLRPTLNLKESSVEQTMFSNRVDADFNGTLDPVGLSSNIDDAVAEQPAEDEAEEQTSDRSPEEAGGGMMQSVDI